MQNNQKFNTLNIPTCLYINIVVLFDFLHSLESNFIPTRHVLRFSNSSPKSPKIGHPRSSGMGTRFPKWGPWFSEWGTRIPQNGTRFTEMCSSFPECGTWFPEWGTWIPEKGIPAYRDEFLVSRMGYLVSRMGYPDS